MEDISTSALRILKQFYTQPNENNGGNYNDYDQFCLHTKALILRSIQKRMDYYFHDGVLESMILVDELDRGRGVHASDAMRKAFCALAVHRTLMWLHLSWDDYFDAVRRIWVKEIGDLELSGASCLISTDLARWRKDIEAALWDRETAKRLLRIETADEVRRLVRVYLEEAFKPKRLHSEGSQGHGNNEQGAPNEAIKKDHDSIDGNALIPFANHTGEPSQTKEGNEDFSRARPKKVPSTKDRNATARTELEDSVDDSSQGTNRCTLPSPRTEHISLLNVDEPKRWMRRRKVNKWTYEEENALAEGVRKYGYQWTRILETYQEICRERTAVDLKDKWRNLQRK
ncbi:hypothetical protein F3Y22_tig00111522pilonHSYRG00052 [Hibiscus syriacus]|uniref:Uncharacterized protein n=1 Tax=Hibiscus syriacus TaxID=106335 RepID=A0A6A2Y764_HIBSY|nr:hypothetical protein F3Y22_tig00111522pilonHSYRG00052 [Hibiscus syriacus]